MKLDNSEVLYPNMKHFMAGLPVERQALLHLLFKRASLVFDEVSPREKEMLLYAYVLGSNDTKGYLHEGMGD